MLLLLCPSDDAPILQKLILLFFVSRIRKMSFWDQFADVAVSEIDRLFVREDQPCTLEELLLEPTVIQEAIGYNTYVIDL